MTLCFGTFAKILNSCKPSKKNPTQRNLINAMLSSVYPLYVSAGIQDTDSTKLLNCTQPVSPSVRDAARKMIADGKLQEVVSNFNNNVIKPNFIKTDERTKKIIVLAIKDIIQRDTIGYDVVVDVVNGITKKALLNEQGDFEFVDFLTGIFLYTITAVDNDINKNAKVESDVAEVRTITDEYIFSFIKIIDAEEKDTSESKDYEQTIPDAQNRFAPSHKINEQFLVEASSELTPVLTVGIDVNELLEEVENKCRIPGCNVRIRYYESGQTRHHYKIVKIFNQNNASIIGNPVNASYLALCIEHGSMYENPTEEQAKMLQEIKSRWKKRRAVRDRLDKLDLDAEVRHLLMKFDLERRNTPRSRDYTIVKTEEKIADTKSALYEEINEYVALHFKSIGGVIKSLEREMSGFSANSFGAQITLAFESINRADYSQGEIFDKLSDWLKEKTDSTDTTICRIVIAYYVRLCNVFKPLKQCKEVDNEPSE